MFEKKEQCLGCWKIKKIYRSGHCKDCYEKKCKPLRHDPKAWKRPKIEPDYENYYK